MPLWMLRNRVAFNAADEGGAGGAAPAPAADPASILYPDEGQQAPADPPAGEQPAGEQPAASEWKEYENNPAKSDEENAAAKAEHDKTKPVAEEDKVPEDGKYALKMPDGVPLDEKLLEAVAPTFKELGLSHKQAQSLADKFIAHQTAQAEQWGQTVEGWANQARQDPEIGGVKWDNTVQAATSVVRRFGNEGLREYLNASGGGNHPEMIRFMAKVAAVIGEDRSATSDNLGKPVAPDRVGILYPDDQPKG